MLDEQELERYARHILLRDVGGPGQQKLKAARVLIIGAGGLGSPVLAYLAAAGVGTLGVVDDDHVSLSNLQRQIIHDSDAIDVPKVESARRSLARINPHVTLEAHECRLDESNGAELVAKYDLVVDGSDNFDTRYLVADLCETAEVPLITAAVGLFDGSITTLKPFDRNEAGQLNPRYRDLFPKKPEAGSIPSCAEAGVLGALTGVIGSLQAVEVIKEIVGLGEGLVGRLMLYDSRAARFETIKYRRRPD
ncbi:molybdopterin-synthase adenylyltransferase MoeB [Cohaesibacter gelatinilyticus]|uniref:Molybdopterin-synthase adenylyltransferase n=1 Tax=Cohaesibacter gelatinilyticus TaxID=372072 RepID=A0A285PE10_9HYPH|nr:molybdopterin-synthase adenylyltransferase MoeB [Cohaesibacter gelatinilyticus]SNZ20000.1 adenylyltransferase and sulfurtransferase [Cohaesibacter gelatinilyticus]